MRNDKTNLAKKIKALAEAGFQGEKEAAQRLLKAFMDKHGIKDEDLETEQEIELEFKIPPKGTIERRLFAQILWAVTGKDSASFLPRSPNRAFVKGTPQQLLEVKAKFEFYRDQFKEEQNALFLAFIHQHSLFSKTAQTKKIGEEPKTDQELSRKAALMTAGLSKRTFNKTLNEPDK